MIEWRHEPTGTVVLYDPQVVGGNAVVRVPLTGPPHETGLPYRTRSFHHEHHIPLDALRAFARHLTDQEPPT